MSDGRAVTAQMVKTTISEVLDKLRTQMGDDRFESSQLRTAAKILDDLMTGEKFQEFLTLVAYDYLD